MTPSSPPSASRRAERQQTARRQAQRQRLRRRLLRIGSGVGALIVAGVVVWLIVGTPGLAGRAQAPAGVQTFSGLARTHTTDPVSYPQTPPVGGPHAQVWQNCGYYAAPIANEHGVHSLEHGAVWITYQPNLPSDQVATLRQIANSQTYVLVSPYPNLPAPVVASAWGKQLRLDSANDSRLSQFVSAFRQGPQTPERGASCTGGTSVTQ